ncbi:TIR domain-containing protein [Fournierella massiliensis]|uniref:TIR domain-containing protein n=1 Tax=Allofournierella massiliensis TaxID=1650663 RepID=UPI00352180E1
MCKNLLENVYVTAGVPQITYVEPKEFLQLKVALRTRGKCVVVEGPSGIGKTTAIKKAIGSLNLENVIYLSARKKSDENKIKEIADGNFTGIQIIDDFHRLDSEIKEKISDVMKYLADENVEDQKIVVIGINRVGDSLITFSPDLNSRISTIKFEVNPEEKLFELIEKGENALNIEFDNKRRIVENSYGSFQLAQLMCHQACIENKIDCECDEKLNVHFSFACVQSAISSELSRSYFNIAREFAIGNRLRREGRAPYLHVLKWLSESDTWAISLMSEMQRHPEAKAGVTQIVEKGYLDDFLKKRQTINNYVHYDKDTRMLIAEDPKFIFYLKTINWNNFARDIGYLQLISERKYDFALSFAGSERVYAEKIFNRLTALEISVFYDKNEQHNILSENVEEYLYPIYNSEAIYVVPLLSQNYPNRVWTKFESKAFKDRFGQHAVIPIWFKGADTMFDESKNYGGLSFDPEDNVDQQIDDIVTSLAKKIEDHKITF